MVADREIDLGTAFRKYRYLHFRVAFRAGESKPPGVQVSLEKEPGNLNLWPDMLLDSAYILIL